MVKRKLYNPFKMWGSYVGAYLLPVFSINITQIFSPFLNIEFSFIQFLWPIALSVGFGSMILLLMLIIGFLIGWGIHSLFRRLVR